MFLRVAEVNDEAPPRPPSLVIPFTQFTTAMVYQYIGPISGVVREGVWGAPIVIDDLDCGMVGFF